MREERVAEVVGGGGTALWATGVEEDAPAVEVFMTVDIAGSWAESGADDEGLPERVLERETRVAIFALRRHSAQPEPLGVVTPPRFCRGHGQCSRQARIHP